MNKGKWGVYEYKQHTKKHPYQDLWDELYGNEFKEEKRQIRLMKKLIGYING